MSYSWKDVSFDSNSNVANFLPRATEVPPRILFLGSCLVVAAHLLIKMRQLTVLQRSVSSYSWEVDCTGGTSLKCSYSVTSTHTSLKSDCSGTPP